MGCLGLDTLNNKIEIFFWKVIIFAIRFLVSVEFKAAVFAALSAGLFPLAASDSNFEYPGDFIMAKAEGS